MAGIFGSVSKKAIVQNPYIMASIITVTWERTTPDWRSSETKALNAKSMTFAGEFQAKISAGFRKDERQICIGVIGYDIQPIVLSCRHGVFSLVMNGNIANLAEIIAELQSNGANFAEIQPDSSISPAEVLAEIISNANSLESGIEKVFDRIRGSVSLLVLTNNGIFAARDRLATPHW